MHALKGHAEKLEAYKAAHAPAAQPTTTEVIKKADDTQLDRLGKWIKAIIQRMKG
jgi:hypothetical protein